ncbi:MAG TPA: HD domain-containing phosphohydrolase [Thermoanaerobaculia bacterium]
MQPEVVQIEPKLKEILYRCLEEVRATKAALYLSQMSQTGDAFELVTQYGFRDAVRPKFTNRDDVVDKLLTKRSAFYVNGLTSDPRFSELLYQSDTSHILVAPIYSRGKLVGFIDLRDKAAKQPFEMIDLEHAQKIVDQFLELFAQKSLFGQQKLPTVTNVRIGGSETAPGASNRIVAEAKAAIARGALRPATVRTTLAEAHLNAGAAIVPAILGLPGVLIAGLSASGPLGGAQVIAAKAEIAPDAMEQFQGKLHAWLQKRGDPDLVTKTTTVQPFGVLGPSIDANRLVSMLSAPVTVGAIRGIVLSVAFETQPDAHIRSRLEKALAQIQDAIENALAVDALRDTREKIAEKLLEPDSMRCPVLVAHSRRVAELSERLARFVGSSESEVEKVRLAALVHDVGMRLLDYAQLYRKINATGDDLKTLREHAVVGAALVAASALGPEIANIVLSHHERPDGTGYPNGVMNEQIPLAARIIHVCESYDAMTAEDSYQGSVDSASALGKIKRAGGTQFDPDLALKFCEMMG